MTQDEIIRMAQQAGIAHAAGIYMEHLERFAALVAAHEREACAKVCEEMYRRDGFAVTECESADECAAAIRAMGEK